MNDFAGALKRGILAMAGRRSPWGGGDRDGGEPSPGDGDGSDENGQTGSGNGGDGPSEPPRKPRNPWLPAGDGEPRRSANIEDIFRNRQQSRRGGGGGGGGLPPFPKRANGKSWFPWIVGGIAAIGLGMSMVHIIGPKEQAVVKTLGNYTRTFDPGFHLSLPFPFETVDVEDVRGVRAVRIPKQGQNAKLILTGDQNLVDLSYIVRWNIDNLEDFKFRLADPVETVNEVGEAATRASVAEKKLDSTFTGQGRAEIEQDVRKRMQQSLDEYQAGIKVLGVEIAKADPPSDVVDAFRDVSVAEQNADAARNRARGYAQQVLARAEGEAQAFDKVYEEYRLAPEVTRRRIYYETMERVLSQTDKMIIEADGVTPYLPLPEIRRRSENPPQTTVVGRNGAGE